MTNDLREDRRRILRVRANVRIGDAAVEVRTHDISEKGISLLLPFSTSAGAQAQIAFSLFYDGKIRSVSLTARAIHCTLSTDLFRTGFAFVAVPPVDQKIITAYCSER